MNEGVSPTGQQSSNTLTSISLPFTAGGGDSNHHHQQIQGTPMSRLPVVSASFAAADRSPQQTTIPTFHTQPSQQQQLQNYQIQSPTAESPDRKRVKLEVLELGSSCESTNNSGGNDDLAALKRRILEHKYMRLRSVREKYSEHVSELFFLQQGGNMMDYPTWRKKPQSPQFITFSRQHRLDQSQLDEFAVKHYFHFTYLC